MGTDGTGPTRPRRDVPGVRRRAGAYQPNGIAVLDLGAGPGFLAQFLLGVMPDLELTLLDFSAPMHDLARVRLAEHLHQVRFLHLGFKSPGLAPGSREL